MYIYENNNNNEKGRKEEKMKQFSILAEDLFKLSPAAVAYYHHLLLRPQQLHPQHDVCM